MKEYNEVLAAVRANGNVVIDDHGNRDNTLMLTGVAGLVKESGEVIPVALCNSRYFSLNRLYVDEAGKPHVSREAVAGCVQPMKYHNNLVEALQGYNEEQRSCLWSAGKLDHVVVFERKTSLL